MRKSVLKVSAMLMMLLSVSFSMQSCGLFDDVFDTPVEDTTPSDPKDDESVTPSGAEVTVKDLAAITDLLDEKKSDIEATAKNGEEYELTIKSDGLETSAADYVIEVPMVEGSNINLNFANEVSTETALVVKDEEAEGKTPAEAVNKLTITMPASKGLNLELDMPETTVTLKAASGEVVYDEVVATTALNTLYIEKGVTVKNLQVKGGSVVVNGTAETFVYAAAADYDDVLRVYEDSIKIGSVNDWRIEKSTIIKDYHFKNLKVIKGEDAEYANISLSGYGDPLEKLTLAEGVVVKSINNEPAVRMIEAEGEGAEFLLAEDSYFPLHLQAIEMKGVTFAADEDDYLYSVDGVHSNLENCTFKFDKVYFSNHIVQTAIGSVKNCKFEATIINVTIPRQSDVIPSHKLSFRDCDFNQGFEFGIEIPDWDYVYEENGEIAKDYYWYYYDSSGNYNKVKDESEIPDDATRFGESWDYKKTNAKYEDYDVTIIFDNCTAGNGSLPNPSDFISEFDIPTGVNVRYVIDGKTYGYVDNSLVEM